MSTSVTKDAARESVIINLYHSAIKKVSNIIFLLAITGNKKGEGKPSPFKN
jgi:hypothetical protein